MTLIKKTEQLEKVFAKMAFRSHSFLPLINTDDADQKNDCQNCQNLKSRANSQELKAQWLEAGSCRSKRLLRRK